jgi:hypothetical protein
MASWLAVMNLCDCCLFPAGRNSFARHRAQWYLESWRHKKGSVYSSKLRLVSTVVLRVKPMTITLLFREFACFQLGFPLCREEQSKYCRSLPLKCRAVLSQCSHSQFQSSRKDTSKWKWVCGHYYWFGLKVSPKKIKWSRKKLKPALIFSK